MDIQTQRLLCTVLGGGIGGGLGALVGSVAGRLVPEKHRNGVFASIAVSLMMIGSSTGPLVFSSLLHPDVGAIEARLLSDPSFGPVASAWKEHDETAFREFAVRVGRKSRDSDEIPSRARVALEEVVSPRLANLDDSELIGIARLLRDEMRELKTSNPASCHPLLHGKQEMDIAPYLSEGLNARGAALLVALIRADAPSRSAALQGKALDADVERVVRATAEEVGGDIALLAPDAAVQGREANACDAAAAFYDHLVRMPEADAAALLRGLFSRARDATI